MNNQEIYTHLEQLRQKGVGSIGKVETDMSIMQLKGKMDEDDYLMLSISYIHAKEDGDSAGFYNVLGDLISKYRQDPKSPIQKTLL